GEGARAHQQANQAGNGDAIHGAAPRDKERSVATCDSHAQAPKVLVSLSPKRLHRLGERAGPKPPRGVPSACLEYAPALPCSHSSVGSPPCAASPCSPVSLSCCC